MVDALKFVSVVKMCTNCGYETEFFSMHNFSQRNAWLSMANLDMHNLSQLLAAASWSTSETNQHPLHFLGQLTYVVLSTLEMILLDHYNSLPM